MNNKTCCQCRLDLPPSEFAKHPRYGLQSMCKPCNRAYQRDHYQRNRADYLAKAAAWAARRRAENLVRILAYLELHPCADCGETDPRVLQFDHVRGVKVAEVSRLYYGGSSWQRVLAEIEKCEVRCAVCHFRKHARAQGWRRLELAVDLALAAAVMAAAPPPRPGVAARSALPPVHALKWCGYCGWDLPPEEFAIHGSGRQSKCKACQRAYARDHYQRNRDRYLSRVRARNLDFQETNSAFLVNYLRSHPCVDCGEPDPVVLQFDHVRGVKSADIAQLVRNAVRWERIEAEVAKCEVRCVNCHFRRTSACRRTTAAQRAASAPPTQGSFHL